MPVTLFQRPRLKINIKIHKMEFTETTAVPINLFAIRSLRLCQKIPWHRGKPYPPLYFALMHFLGPPQAHSPARVSRSISSIYKAPGGGKIDVAAHNARGLVGWRARELFLPSPSASSPTLSLLFFFFTSYALVPDSSSVKCVSLSPVTIAWRGSCSTVAATPMDAMARSPTWYRAE